MRIIAGNEEDHQAWFGLCESRLRILIAGLDSVDYGTHAYPFTKFFVRSRDGCSLAQDDAAGDTRNDAEATTSTTAATAATATTTMMNQSQGEGGRDNSGTKLPVMEDEERVTYFFIALRFVAGVESVDLIGCTTEFSYSVNGWEGRKKGMDLKIDHVLQGDLPHFVFEGSLRKGNIGEGDYTDDFDGDGDGKCDVDAGLNGMSNPDDCLASPMKKARIGRT